MGILGRSILLQPRRIMQRVASSPSSFVAPLRLRRQAEVLKQTSANKISVPRATKLRCKAQESPVGETSKSTHDISLKRRDSLFLGAGSAMFSLPEDAQARELSPEDAANLAIIKKVCKLMAKRELKELEALVHEECKVVKLGPSDLPYAGKYFGQTAVTDYYAKFEQFLRVDKMHETLYYIGEANAIFVAQDYEYEVTSNRGVRLNTSVAMKMVVEDGKLKKMAIIGDTLSE